jgi:hypothetical protein
MTAAKGHDPSWIMGTPLGTAEVDAMRTPLPYRSNLTAKRKTDHGANR